MVDINQLKAVRSIAEAGSITAAARTLGMSQPGLSRLVERLEDELDANLFVRGRRGAELTPDGRKLLEFARSTLSSYDMLCASVSGRRGKAGDDQGVLKIVASTTPGEYLLPQIASEFARGNEGVAIETLITDSSAVANLLVSGEYDVGFSGKMADFGVLRYVKIARDEIVLAVPGSHPFSKLGEIEISQLEGEKMLRRESGSGTYDVVESALRQKDEQLPGTTSLALGSTQAVVSAVDAGVGVGFVTLRAIEQHAPSRVAAVRVSGLPILRDLFLVYEPERRLSRTARNFIEYVEENGEYAG